MNNASSTEGAAMITKHIMKNKRCTAKQGRQIRCEKEAGHEGSHSAGNPQIQQWVWESK
jgi:hypothetical protein